MKSTNRNCHGCPLNFLQRREQNASKISWGPSIAYATFLTNRLDFARNLYRKDLYAHFGCVNAIEFSHEGCWLISGGDDRRVLLWNLESSLSGKCKPTPMVEEHSSNIFCLSFDAFNSKIFSAGNDEQVIVHDVKTGETVNVFMHEEAIYGVSVDPYRDSVFASAGEDGQILVFDIRAPASSGPLLLARSYDAFHAVQFHPVEPTFVVTANSKEGVALWDVRKPCVPLVKYGERHCAESSMCARFNSSGTQIIALRRRMHPVLFNTQSPTPVCEFDADHYYNSCTMKSCCFAGSTDQFVLSGSDDFNLYMWRIPDPHNDVSFIPDAHLVLRGHRSIVNQVRFNSHNMTIASSGVEKIVKLWSPVAVPGSYGTLVDENRDSRITRRVYTHEDYIGLVLDSGQTVSHDYSHGSTDEDPMMMAFFDSLVQREVEGWTTNTDLSDDGLEAASNPTHSSSSVPSSHSDDTDSDSTWVSPPQNSSFIRRQRLAASRGAHVPIGDADLPPPSRARPKSRRGSDWILHLIAKKRAQLRAAKKNRRNVMRRQKSKARQFIRCFTSSRQYLYRPENNRSLASNCLTRAAPADLLRRRHVVAPYTMMSLSEFADSDEEDDDDDEGSDENHTIKKGSDSKIATAVAVNDVSSHGKSEQDSDSPGVDAASTSAPSGGSAREGIHGPREGSPSGDSPRPQPPSESYEGSFASSEDSLSDEDGSEPSPKERAGIRAKRRSSTDDGSPDHLFRVSQRLLPSTMKEASGSSASYNGLVHTLSSPVDNQAWASHYSSSSPKKDADSTSDFAEVSNGNCTPLPISAVSTDESGALVFDLAPLAPTGTSSSSEHASLGLFDRVDFKEIADSASIRGGVAQSDNSLNSPMSRSSQSPFPTSSSSRNVVPPQRRGRCSKKVGRKHHNNHPKKVSATTAETSSTSAPSSLSKDQTSTLFHHVSVNGEIGSDGSSVNPHHLHFGTRGSRRVRQSRRRAQVVLGVGPRPGVSTSHLPTTEEAVRIPHQEVLEATLPLGR